MVRRFFHANIPHFHRVLLIESGSRYLLEGLLPGLYEAHPEIQCLDLVTCFGGVPQGFDPQRGDIYYTHDWVGRERRTQLYQGLRNKGYDVAGMICSGEPIMTRWKWTLAWQAPAKYFLLNENGDYVWFDYTQWKTLRHFVLVRSGLSGAGSILTIGRLLLFPFTLIYLLAFAAAVHARRKLRT